MQALKFELHFPSSIFNLFALYKQLELFISKQSEEETVIEGKTISSIGGDQKKKDLEQLLSLKKEYFKTDFFFTCHPLKFNLVIFHNFLSSKPAY